MRDKIIRKSQPFDVICFQCYVREQLKNNGKGDKKLIRKLRELFALLVEGLTTLNELHLKSACVSSFSRYLKESKQNRFDFALQAELKAELNALGFFNRKELL